MLLFLVLSMTSGFTILVRRIFLVCTAIYFFHLPDLPSPFLFLAGALFAELSLSVLPQSKPALAIVEEEEPRRSWIREHWPMGLLMLGLFLGSSPPENPWRTHYSRVIWSFFERYITPVGGTFQLSEDKLTVLNRLQ